jgi:hypothetical protein
MWIVWATGWPTLWLPIILSVAPSAGVRTNYNCGGKIYRLGAEAYQAKIDHLPYQGIVDRAKIYNTMADWYRRAVNSSMAANAKQKAIEAK